MEGDTESKEREFNLQLEMQSRILSKMNRDAESIILRLPNHFHRYGEFTFYPEIVSIGPYHRGRGHLKLMEDKKWTYLHRLFMRFDEFSDYQSYYSEAKSLVNEAKKCYRDELDSDMANDDNFALMLLLDGSFILECLFPRDKYLPPPPSVSSVVSVRGPLAIDLIKFENQIPFFVLESLYAYLNEVQRYPDIRTLVSDYITRYCIQIPSLNLNRSRIRDTDRFHHLLGFFHRCVYGRHSSRPTETIPWIPTACALQEAGIKIKCLHAGGFLQVFFAGGTLMISPLLIDHRTHSMLHNFLAWEQYCPGEGNFVTSYCTFIGCLVNTAADVLLLRQAKILTNHLGSDEQAAGLINSLPKYLGDEEFTLWKEFEGINRRCQSRLTRYEARLRRDYCGHPWAIISVLAAFVLLVLASVQTVYTVLSFYHQK